MLDHIYIGVSDLDRSAAFYAGALEPLRRVRARPRRHNVEAVCHLA